MTIEAMRPLTLEGVFAPRLRPAACDVSAFGERWAQRPEWGSCEC